MPSPTSNTLSPSLSLFLSLSLPLCLFLSLSSVFIIIMILVLEENQGVGACVHAGTYCIVIKELEYVDHMVYELTLWFGGNNVLICPVHLVLTVGGVICAFLKIIICFPAWLGPTYYVHIAAAVCHIAVCLSVLVCVCILA